MEEQIVPPRHADRAIERGIQKYRRFLVDVLPSRWVAGDHQHFRGERLSVGVRDAGRRGV